MTTVVYSCPFVPAEWIAAHGLRPRRILPEPDNTGSAAPGAGFCPYAWSFATAVRQTPDAEAIVFTTVCDQMRRAWELVVRDSQRPAFLMNVPSTWQTAAAQKLYLSELERLGRFLVTLGGATPSPEELARVMCEYQTRRTAVRDAGGALPARRFAEAVARFHRDGVVDVPAAGTTRVRPGIPVALVGGPLPPRHFAIFEIIERAGGTVVLDATANGERTMPAPFDRRRLRDGPLLTLTDAYFGSIPDAFRRPNTQLYQWMARELPARGVRGIILRCYTWCDIWRVEAERMKEWANVPLLLINSGAGERTEAHTVSRIESFLEMLR